MGKFHLVFHILATLVHWLFKKEKKNNSSKQSKNPQLKIQSEQVTVA